ncbi:MAG: hypothetical protein E6K78_08110 [Candidatus Eisenbacteria bacterium]|uniref:Bacterial surface antigen (D15) domain-containing protein n=1 Tax=Eiseniibacteriota bacterium TaxID=2212470 RepID=A0A538TNC4_UNCEI|nr:MAG: hypothetical protein E6K78_08110 [Candidatus Eisenbacteria bacterium]
MTRNALLAGALVGALLAAPALGSMPDTPVARGGAPFIVALADTGGAAATSRDLGPTTAPPWNPPHAVPSAEPWEQAARLPGRVVSLPLSLLGSLTRHGLLSMEEKHLVPRTVVIVAALPRLGIIVTPASLGDRTGLGGRFGLTPPFLKRALEAEWSGSTRHYSRTRVRASQGALSLEYGYDWRPEERFYGLSDGSSQKDTASFATQTTFVRLGLAYRFAAETGHVPLEVRAWIGPRSQVVRDGREDHVTPLSVGFPSVSGGVRQEHLVYGVSLEADARRGRPHWSRGARAELSVEQFTSPTRLLALNDGSMAPVQFTRWGAKAEAGISFWRDPRTIRFAGRIVNQVADVAGQTLAVADLAQLGGSQGLAGYEPGRFHDMDLMVGKVSYIFPLAQHYEFDIHAEAGGVFETLRDAHDATPKTSYGVALRPRTALAPLGSINLDWSRESVRFGFHLGGVE